MIYDHKQAWLKKRGRSKARNSDSKHSGIKTEHLENWKDRWDVLRIGLSSATLHIEREGYRHAHE